MTVVIVTRDVFKIHHVGHSLQIECFSISRFAAISEEARHAHLKRCLLIHRIEVGSSERPIVGPARRPVREIAQVSPKVSLGSSFRHSRRVGIFPVNPLGKNAPEERKYLQVNLLQRGFFIDPKQTWQTR